MADGGGPFGDDARGAIEALDVAPSVEVSDEVDDTVPAESASDESVDVDAGAETDRDDAPDPEPEAESDEQQEEERVEAG